MKKCAKIIASVSVCLFFAAAVMVLLGWKAGIGPLAYLRYDMFSLSKDTCPVVEEEMICGNGKEQLTGMLYRPQYSSDKQKKRQRLVIFCHGLNGTAEKNRFYCRKLAESGIAVYAFDFKGGSTEGKSGGDCVSMSVKTQMNDLELVIETVKQWEWVDPNRITLMGESMGGLVCSLTASVRDDMESLVLFYPAFSLPDMVRKAYGARENIPETFSLMGMEVGKVFAEDLWDLDPYEEIEAFRGEVLIVHGTKDQTVSFGSSKRACAHFQHAGLYAVRGAGHGFSGDDMLLALEKVYEFLTEKGR